MLFGGFLHRLCITKWCGDRLNYEAPGISFGDDSAAARRGEVRSKDRHWTVGVALEEFATRPTRHLTFPIEPAIPLRMNALHRMMHQVTGNHRLLASRGDSHAEMAGSMSGSRLEPDLVADSMGIFDQIDQTCVDDRPHRVFDRIARELVLLHRPVSPFLAADETARLGEGRHPAVVHQGRIPADVVDVQMGAQHRIDGILGESGFFEIIEKRRMQHVPSGERARLVVTEAGIDDDSFVAGFQEERMATHTRAPAFVREMGYEPFALALDIFERGFGKDEGALRSGFHFDHAGDGDVADFPTVHLAASSSGIAANYRAWRR